MDARSEDDSSQDEHVVEAVISDKLRILFFWVKSTDDDKAEQFLENLLNNKYKAGLPLDKALAYFEKL